MKDWNDAHRAGVSALKVADAAWTTPESEPGNKTGTWKDYVMTSADLQRKRWPPVSYVVPGLIPEGLSLLAGRPKVGKSWAALEIAIAKATGGTCLGGRQLSEGDVLYAALEDNPRRLQRRIDKLLSPFSTEWPKRLVLATTWRRLDKGGVDDIGEWADEAADPRLIIMDTLAGIKPIKTTAGYTEDYESLTALHRLANDRGLAILVLHHTRKMEADDPLDTISGTLGLAGCADTAVVIARSSKGTTLYVRGRDIEEGEHAVTFDKHTCKWSIIGAAAEVHRSQERSTILEALREAANPLSRKEIVAATGMKDSNVGYLLHQMGKDGEVEKEGRGLYKLP